ncbi:CsoS2 family carboxysome shell protein [Acidihalobacter ferrooxydans]|uniref:Carboxysome shell protein n=1 Tax=Acidihalobacter ferrooxydans TaxID=1765967 RepID=A0A1P8UI59_9GAMM|nr:CsoS2 family carboxysome shell protein [Acidihalobacter ferrooxydans]APZ43507.1 hypothetical protein BW247_10755 [Acidihalobacter ferrooxydans]
MTQISSETHAEVRLSGRELARQRRQAMATVGKRAVQPAGRHRSAAAVQQASAAVARPAVATATQSPRPTVGAAPNTEASGRAKARQRREAMSRGGKAALPGAQSAGTRPTRAPRQQVQAAARREADCGCGCKGEKARREPAQAVEQGRAAVSAAGKESLSPKEISARLAMNHGRSSGRDIAQARRKALAIEGKAGMKRAAQATKIAKYLPDQDWRVALDKGVTGRQIAMQRRKVQSLTGRAEAGRQQAGDVSRKSSGRRTARALSAPPKVEEGHTLAGHGVTGTMVERAPQVTGNEAGSCRPVTGTEYIGAEQFDAFCKTRPEAGPAKVTNSHTFAGRPVSGTSVMPDTAVTGNEFGACREITGSQYLSADHFESICSTRPQVPAEKVGVTQTQKGKTMTGTMVAAESRVTGGEAGAGREITGTRYARADAARPAPGKVARSETGNGSAVTGTAVGQSARITGIESGACRTVSGTEYLGSEQYAEFCGTAAPRQPRKVSVMSTPNQQPVTGTSVARDLKMTGNEPGSCRAITGTPYFNSQDFGDACALEAPAKVGVASTRAGTRVSGTEVNSNPKMTGDEEGRCNLVTGTDYVGAQDLQAVCVDSTPADHAVSKVSVDQTWQGDVITGTGIGRSVKMTGDEFGSCAPISGTPYIGQGQYAQFCEASQADEQLARVPTRGIVSASDITGDRPGAGGSLMTGDARGACEPVTGTPYVGADNMPAECAVDSAASGRFVAWRQQHPQAPRPAAPEDFSVASPARQAFEQRASSAVTGSLMSNTRISGSANRAEGLITGTPEFRHRDTGAAAVQTAQAQAEVRQRLTGEASQRNATITGDAWGTQQHVTGTEGHFSVSRNPTMRGAPRGAGRNAQGYRDLERPEVPDSPVTGSAGAAKRGAVVTVSGGARG